MDRSGLPSQIATICKAFWKTVIGKSCAHLAGPTLGLGQPSTFRSRGPRRPATMTAQSEPRRVRVPAGGTTGTETLGSSLEARYAASSCSRVVMRVSGTKPDHRRDRSVHRGPAGRRWSRSCRCFRTTGQRPVGLVDLGYELGYLPGSLRRRSPRRWTRPGPKASPAVWPRPRSPS